MCHVGNFGRGDHTLEIASGGPQKEIGCPFVIEVRGKRINFTQPLCLPCSLLWFISSPTLYEKRQPATKRGLDPQAQHDQDRPGLTKYDYTVTISRFLQYFVTFYTCGNAHSIHLKLFFHRSRLVPSASYVIWKIPRASTSPGILWRNWWRS